MHLRKLALVGSESLNAFNEVMNRYLIGWSKSLNTFREVRVKIALE